MPTWKRNGDDNQAKHHGRLSSNMLRKECNLKESGYLLVAVEGEAELVPNAC